MKSKLLLAVAVAFGILAFAGVHAEAAPDREEIQVIMDGRRLPFPDARPFIDENNRTMVPVRFVAERLGAKVAWHADLERVDIALDGKYISLTIGENKALVNGEEVVFDTAAVIKDSRTFVPLRFVSEALGVAVEWDGVNRYIWLGEKVVLTPEEKGLPVTPVDEELLKYFENNPDNYFLRRFQGFYIITEDDLPIKKRLYTTYNVRVEDGHFVAVTGNHVTLYGFLSENEKIRVRNFSNIVKHEGQGDMLKEVYFPFSVHGDREFSFEMVDYILIDNGAEDYGILLKMK